MTKYRSFRVVLIIRCIVNPDQYMPNCLDSVIHVMREHFYIGGQGIWMLISYLFKFIIAFFCMRRQTMNGKASMNVVQAHNCSC